MSAASAALTAAETALAAHDLPTARRAIADARRALGHWGAGNGPLATEPRQLAAEWLAVAADALEGDTWPDDAPYPVREWWDGPMSSDEIPPDVRDWLKTHAIVKPAIAGAALASAREALQ